QANKMAAHSYIAISELHPNLSHPNVAGIIIWKTSVRSFPDRKNVGAERFTFGFTLRDSLDFFINVTAWGNDAYVNGLSSTFSIGHCVIIENPLVSVKDPEKGEKFCPTTPSLYRLLITEAHSQVYMCSDTTTINQLVPLIYSPVKESRDYYSLGDILANGQSLDGTMINILAAVKSIGEVKYFTTSDSRSGHRLEVKLFDDTVSAFPLLCWDKEAIQLVQKVIPRETVFFIADAKMSFDSFRNCMTATINSKTIITVNPDTREAGLLLQLRQRRVRDEILEDETGEEFHASVFLDSITDVYTVSQLRQKAQDNLEPFFGITYSFISKLDLDSSLSRVLRSRCSRCRFVIAEGLLSCSHELCPGRGQAFSAITGFDLLVDLTDHTGTLQSCSLRSPAAEMFLGCTPEEFTSLTDDQRTTMKWKFLLERCKVYVKILPSMKTKPGIKGIVVSCSLAEPAEVKQHVCSLQQL
uniref:Meiosis-specific with OB domain-containing protein n=1 Tax=Tetraodon nigroviridis TaxID=99883 RepID=H3D5U1_TETNG